LRIVRSGLIDTVQVIYNIFDQSPAETLFPLCRQHNVGVIARVPFDEGGLTGSLTPETSFPRGSFQGSYFRGDRLRETCERVDRLRPLLRDEASSLAQLALKFCLSHPAVSTVIPGMRRPEHAEANCAASDGKPLSADLLATLRTHTWVRNFYQ
jgi:aryl-alcohol dehydrogenase-like predicted oxidoreductase